MSSIIRLIFERDEAISGDGYNYPPTYTEVVIDTDGDEVMPAIREGLRAVLSSATFAQGTINKFVGEPN